jgi:hypothetical protein
LKRNCARLRIAAEPQTLTPTLSQREREKNGERAREWQNRERKYGKRRIAIEVSQ